MKTRPPHPGWGGRGAGARLDWLVAERGWQLRCGHAGVFVEASVDPAGLGRAVSVERARLLDGVAVGDGATLHDVCLRGDSAIGASSRIGASGPVSLDDTLLGAGVSFESGAADAAVVLAGATLGRGTSLRVGCLVDEQASVGQDNDLKNTYLGVASLLGSSTNFCDIALLGGAPGDPVGQSEVGSGSIHFNFGIHGKKWGSWIGSVGALLLTESRSFIGGNTSLIGPCLVPDGTISVVGSQLRGRVPAGPDAQRLVMAPAPSAFQRAFDPELYGAVYERCALSIEIIGRYHALDGWFRVLRPRLGLGDAARDAARSVIALVVDERVRWLEALVSELPRSIARLELASSSDQRARAAEQRRLVSAFEDGSLPARLRRMGPEGAPDETGEAALVAALDAAREPPRSGLYSEAVRGLPTEVMGQTRAWLERLAVDRGVAEAPPPLA